MGGKMPAIITHRLFGERAQKELPEGLIDGEEQLLAFLLGNQGPDPFFFRFSGIPRKLHASHELAHRMHNEHIYEAFQAMHTGVERLPVADSRIGRAFALGMLSHYALDRTVHPYVYAQQNDLISANVDLNDAENEVHAIIESDLDCWLLWQTRKVTVQEYPPAEILICTERIGRVAGALMSHVALTTFGIDLDVDEYPHAVNNMRQVYQLIEPAGSNRNQKIGKLERLFRRHSMLSSLAHPTQDLSADAAANIEHFLWTNPFTGQQSNDSFNDRLKEALADWEKLAEAFIHGGSMLANEIAGINYSGQRSQ